MEKMEYKDTIGIEFKTQVYSTSTQEITDVTPDNYYAYLETVQTSPEEIVELTNVEVIDSATYLVRFYAHTDTHEDIKSGSPYYVSFYWEFNGIKKCERYGVVVMPDV